MALQKTITLKNGMIIDNAYIKIVDFSGDKHTVIFNIEVFINKDHADVGINGLQKDIISFTPDLLSQFNILVQAYNYLKILPAFYDAVDC